MSRRQRCKQDILRGANQGR